MATNDTPPKKPGSDRGMRLPSLPILILLIGFAGIVVMQTQAHRMDFAMVNLISYGIGILTFLMLMGWVFFSGSLSGTVRWGILSLALLGPVVFFTFFRIQPSGELLPTFRLRWAPKPDERLAQPGVAAAKVPIELRSTSERDFTGFLGPQRDGRAPSVALARNWNEDPPREMWRKPIGAGWSSFAVVGGYAFTLEQRGSNELVTCYDVRSGRLKWSHSVETRHETVLGGVGPRSTPTYDEGRVYALGATGSLRCLDAGSGQVVWGDNILDRLKMTLEQELQGVAWGRANSPLIVDQMVIVPEGGPPGGPFHSLVAYDKDNGQVIWQAGDTQISYSSPNLFTLLGQRQIVIVNESNITGHVPESGEVLWSYDWPGKSNANASASQAVAIGDDRLLVSKAYGGGGAVFELLRGDDGSIRTNTIWEESRVLKTKFTNVVVHEEYVYALSDGILECVRLSDGQQMWKDRAGRFRQGQILGVDDLLLVQAEWGDVVMVLASPEGFQELGRFPALSGQTWNNPALYGNLLLVRNAEEMACFELPTTEQPAEASATE